MKNKFLSSFCLVCLSMLLLSWTPFPNATLAPVSDPGTSIIVPLDQTFWIPCANGGAGEYVNFTGSFHIVSFLKTDANGTEHYQLHTQPQNASGIGLTTGDEFRGTGLGKTSANVKIGITGNSTYIQSFKLIGKGQTPSLKIQEVFHITVNANGELTADVDMVKVTCE